jgi:prepilin-type N-terminal cleavage/methylation domain-containing protein
MKNVRGFSLRGQAGTHCLSPKEVKKRFLSLTGFTLIELVMVILITALLSVAGVHIMQFVVRNSFYLPNQVQADLVAAEALEIIVEGDDQAKGLRFCKAVTTAEANRIIVTNQGVLTNLDNQTITYNLSGGVLYRTIAPGAATKIPYFMAADMTITGSGAGGALFTYYGVNDTLLTQPVTAANVRRIDINLIAQNGAGSSDKYEGTSHQDTSVKVYNI